MADSDLTRTGALSRYRSTPWLSFVATLVAIVVVAVFYANSLNDTVTVMCGGKVMKPGDACIGKNSFSYAEGLRRIVEQRQALRTYAPLFMLLPLGWLLLLLWRSLARARDPLPETQGATWHARGVESSGMMIVMSFAFLGLAFAALTSFDGWNKLIGLIGVLGLLGLIAAWPKQAQIVRADDAGVAAVTGTRKQEIPWGSISAVDADREALVVRHGAGSTRLGPDLTGAAVLAERVAQRGGAVNPALDTLTAIQRGETVAYGKAAISATGLTIDGTVIPWHEVGTVRETGGKLSVTRTDGTLLASVASSQVTDKATLLRLVEAIVTALRTPPAQQ